MKSKLRIEEWEIENDAGISKLKEFRDTMDKMFTEFYEKSKTPVRHFGVINFKSRIRTKTNSFKGNFTTKVYELREEFTNGENNDDQKITRDDNEPIVEPRTIIEFFVEGSSPKYLF